jgi:methyl-accepting chemotaxis protein
MFEKDPRTFEADMKGLMPEQKAMVKLEITLTQFFRSLNASITRWEWLVYPLLFVVGLLGLSGFYLIYNMTKDMKTLTQHVDPQMAINLGAMSNNMAELSKNISTMTGQISILVEKIGSIDSHITNMDGNIGSITESIGQVKLSMDAMTADISLMQVSTNVMSNDIGDVNKSIQVMTVNVADMNQAMRAMTVNTGVMSRDINQMGRPMDFMNSFTPW